MRTLCIALAWSLALQIQGATLEAWRAGAPRDEIRPQFHREETGGKSGHGALTIQADGRQGLHGWWENSYSVTGGQYYRFSAWRRAENIAVPRRNVLARVLWRGGSGNAAPR